MRWALWIILALPLAACEPAPSAQTDLSPPQYLGISTRLLEGNLVGFEVKMAAPASPDALEAYAQCAAAQYTLIRGFGFAQHVRTTFDTADGIASADAAYLISAALPGGKTNIDAEVAVAACVENDIPTV